MKSARDNRETEPVDLLQRVKEHTPWPIRQLSRRIKRELHWAQNGRRPLSDVFHKIYEQNVWGSGGSGGNGAFYSGPGSEDVPASIYAEGIRRFIAAQGVRSVVDLGCGDFRVAGRFLDPEISYVGIDVVEPLIAANQARFAGPNIRFEHLDITADPLPQGDLCLLREVLQHLSNTEILRILPKLAQYKFAIYSDYQPADTARLVPNRDIAHGQDTRIWLDSALYLDQPPFGVRTELLFEAPATTALRGPGERIRTFLIHL